MKFSERRKRGRNVRTTFQCGGACDLRLPSQLPSQSHTLNTYSCTMAFQVCLAQTFQVVYNYDARGWYIKSLRSVFIVLPRRYRLKIQSESSRFDIPGTTKAICWVRTVSTNERGGKSVNDTLVSENRRVETWIPICMHMRSRPTTAICWIRKQRLRFEEVAHRVSTNWGFVMAVIELLRQR